MERIDKIVAEKFNLTREESKKIIEAGYVFFKDKPVFKQSFKIDENEINLLKVIPEYQKMFVKEEKNITEELKKSIKILYEDDYIYIIEKDAGIIVTDDDKDKITLVDIMKSLGMILSESDKGNDGIVHRLDKDTSGILIITKTAEANKKFKELFQSREIEKKYIAIVSGNLKLKNAKIDIPIIRSKTNRTKMIVSKDGKNAVTFYNVLKEWKGYSLVKVRIETGRTHQIRVHLSRLGNPIIGDEKYSSRKLLKRDFFVKRQMLHAKSINFIHPFLNKEIFIESEPSLDFKEAIQFLDNI